MTRTEWLNGAFEACGDDVDKGLKFLHDTDPDGALIGWFIAEAPAALYRTRYGRWRSTQLRALAQSKDKKARLFEVDEVEVERHIRETLVFEGREYRRVELAGKRGAAILQAVAERDVRPALTTIERCRFDLKLAEAIEKESARQGRDVSVAEVLGLEVAA